MKGQDRVVPVEFSRPKDDAHDLSPENQDQDTRRNDEKQNLPESFGKIMDEDISFIARGVVGKNRKNSDGKRNRKDADRKTLQVVGEIENRNTPGGESRSDDRDDEQIDLGDGESHCARNHQSDHFSKIPIFKREAWKIFQSDHFDIRILDEHMEKRSNHHSPSESCDSKRFHQKNRAKNYAEVIHDGRERIYQKSLEGIENSAENSADAKKNRAQKHDARERGNALQLVRWKSGGDKFHQLRGKKCEYCGDDNEKNERRREKYIHEFPGFFFFVFGDKTRENRNESGAQGSKNEEVVHQIRHAEGGIVYVECIPRPEVRSEDTVAKKPQDAAQNPGHGNHTRR